MNELYDLRDILMDSLGQFDTIKEHKLKMGELEALNALTGTMKNVGRICEMEDGGYSEDGYGRGSSYAGRRRDSMGRYSRGDGMDDGGYTSRRDSRGRYSRAEDREEMMEYFRKGVEAAPADMKEGARRFLREMER